MAWIEVYIEHNTLSLNQTFTYHCVYPVQRGCRVRVPFGYKVLVGFVDRVYDVLDKDSTQIKDVIEVLDENPLLNEELFLLADYISKEYISSKISCFKTMLPAALRPDSRDHTIVYEDYIVAIQKINNLTSKQSSVWNTIQSKIPIKLSEARKLSASIVNTLIKKQALVIEKKVKSMTLDIDRIDAPIPELTEEQARVIHEIQNTQDSIFLLHGVTGSGKTEVFLRLAQDVLTQGKQVLFLVPEIGLTPLMIQRVISRFGKEVAIYHSGLNAQEKYDQYRLVQEHKVQIVVGTRSSVFLPFSNLGLILMDEEHDTSYKQDSMPRYHTRDVVLWRSRYHHCKVVLASATPCLESYARAYKHKYHLVELKNRIYKQMPTIHLLDMKQEPSKQGISKTLLNQIQASLDRKEQVILLLNRRGYLPVVRCMDCNEVMTCPDCGVALVYHKKENYLQCHCCGRIFYFHNECPVCQGHNFYQLGMGTEKLEEYLNAFFPSAHIVRMDADSTRKKNAHQKLLTEFEERGDILLGTQMVAKGLDFERVTLVGILQADSMLIRSAYRSSEVAYQMLEQASGRSGRGKKAGNVYIQTFDPSHYVMQSVKNHDYDFFFRKEMQYRHLGQYPPYVYLCSLIVSHKEEKIAYAEAMHIKKQLKEFTVLGPIAISMRQKKQRVRLIVKSKNKNALVHAIWNAEKNRKERRVSLDINMHPLMMEE